MVYYSLLNMVCTSTIVLVQVKSGFHASINLVLTCFDQFLLQHYNLAEVRVVRTAAQKPSFILMVGQGTGIRRNCMELQVRSHSKMVDMVVGNVVGDDWRCSLVCPRMFMAVFMNSRVDILLAFHSSHAFGGVTGGVPWHAFAFLPFYFQQTGYSDVEAAQILLYGGRSLGRPSLQPLINKDINRKKWRLLSKEPYFTILN